MYQIYNLFIDTDNEIFGFIGIKQMFGYGKNYDRLVKEEFRSIYDLNHEVYRILLTKKHLYIGKQSSKKLKGRKIDPEKQLKRTESVRRFWQENKDTKRGNEIREISRNNMKSLISSGKTHTESANIKRVESRKNNGQPWHSETTKENMSKSNTGQIRSEEVRKNCSDAAKKKFENGWRRLGFKHNEDTKKKLSELTKQMWIDGVFTKEGHLFTSNGERDLQRICRIIFPENNILCNKIKFGKSWDIKIDELHIIIEYNGTYWHKDPRFYDADHFDSCKNIYAYEVWNKDIDKMNIAMKNNYSFYTIWQYDWENLENDEQKINFILNLLDINDRF